MGGLPTSRLDTRLPVVWGVLNVTPDSFSDGGRFEATETAIVHGVSLHAQGADVVDVGGESTRPGAARITVEEELDRVLPVVTALAESGICVSIDTTRAEVAVAAVEAGASIVNDVSGGRADAKMHSAVSDLGVPYVIMHWRGESTSMDERAVYTNAAGEIRDEVGEQVERALMAGIDRELLIVDPGIGFAKMPEHNWAALRSLGQLSSLGVPVLVGASRKRFLGALLADDAGPRDTDGRDTATAVLSALLVKAGVWGLRVHDVQGTVDALKVVRALTWDQGEA